MNGHFRPRTEPTPTREWETLPKLGGAKRNVGALWSTRIVWFAIGATVARLVVGG